jgi:DNA gyrase subunit B
LARKEKITLAGEDCREGLPRVGREGARPEILFADQDKLVSSEVRLVVEGINDRLAAWFEQHPSEGKIIGKVVEARCPRGRP